MKSSSAIFFALQLLLVSVAFGQQNSWTNAFGGAWEDPSWSLGILPNATTATALTNGPGKVVTVSATTALNHPGTLNLAEVSVSAPDTQTNALVLTHGTAVAFAATDLEIGSHGIVSNAASWLKARDLSLFSNGLLDQDGGLTQVQDALLVEGVLAFRGGHLEASSASAVVTAEGRISQMGGTAAFGSLLLRSWSLNPITGPAFQLTSGFLSATNLTLGGGNSPTRFVQEGGTNTVAALRLEGWFSEAEYLLNGGALLAGAGTILGSDYNRGELRVGGGLLVVTNSLTLIGGLRHGATLYPGVLTVQGGECLLGRLELGPYALFNHSNGTTRVSGAIVFSASDVFARATATLAGGVLAADEVAYAGAGINLQQTGGSLVVSNRLAFGGNVEYPPLGPAVYSLQGGTVEAPEIEVRSELALGQGGSPTRKILNNQRFLLAGTFRLQGNERLGRLNLLGNSTIRLGGDSNTVSFAGSSAESWSPGAVLYVRDWSHTGHLVFGTNFAGLSSSQLGQIRFVDAAGYPGTNYARILENGAVAPGQFPRLGVDWTGTNMVLTWPGEFVLEEAAAAQGPYLAVESAVSPFIVDPRLHRERYFRLAR